MRKEFTDFLENYNNHFIEAEELIKKFPFAENKIIENAIRKMWLGNFGNKYKDMYIHFDIRRIYYEKDSCPTNYKKDKTPINLYLTEVYVNTFSLFADKLARIFNFEPKSKVFYSDWLNSHFYLRDEELIPFLDEFYEWWIDCRKIGEQKLKEIEILETEEKLKKLKESK